MTLAMTVKYAFLGALMEPSRKNRKPLISRQSQVRPDVTMTRREMPGTLREICSGENPGTTRAIVNATPYGTLIILARGRVDVQHSANRTVEENVSRERVGTLIFLGNLGKIVAGQPEIYVQQGARLWEGPADDVVRYAFPQD